MASSSSPNSPGTKILLDVLTEFKDRVSIDGGSRILVTDATIAKVVSDMVADISTPYGPKFTIATAGPITSSGSSQESLGPLIAHESIADLQSKMDHFTHALTDVSYADGKTAMEIMKWAKYALQPKGICVVVALKETEQGKFTERMQSQSKNRISNLSDILEWAGFERGKIRGMERSAGNGKEAEVVLAMKWDQLTA